MSSTEKGFTSFAAENRREEVNLEAWKVVKFNNHTVFNLLRRLGPNPKSLPILKAGTDPGLPNPAPHPCPTYVKLKPIVVEGRSPRRGKAGLRRRHGLSGHPTAVPGRLRNRSGMDRPRRPPASRRSFGGYASAARGPGFPAARLKRGIEAMRIRALG